MKLHKNISEIEKNAEFIYCCQMWKWGERLRGKKISSHVTHHPPIRRTTMADAAMATSGNVRWSRPLRLTLSKGVRGERSLGSLCASACAAALQKSKTPWLVGEINWIFHLNFSSNLRWIICLVVIRLITTRKKSKREEERRPRRSLCVPRQLGVCVMRFKLWKKRMLQPWCSSTRKTIRSIEWNRCIIAQFNISHIHTTLCVYMCVFSACVSERKPPSHSSHHTHKWPIQICKPMELA